MIERFEVELLDEAFEFLEKLDLKSRKKIFQNIERAKSQKDPKLFKTLTADIWEFRTVYAGKQFRLLAFWDKTDKVRTLVLATHGFIKKTSKVSKKEITRAEHIRSQYYKDKQK